MMIDYMMGVVSCEEAASVIGGGVPAAQCENAAIEERRRIVRLMD